MPRPVRPRLIIIEEKGPTKSQVLPTRSPRSHSLSSSSSEYDFSRPDWRPHITTFDSWAFISLSELLDPNFLRYGPFHSFTTFYSTPIRLGGLGLDPFRIGLMIIWYVRPCQCRSSSKNLRSAAQSVLPVSPAMRYFAQLSSRVTGFITCMTIQLSAYISYFTFRKYILILITLSKA